MQAGDDDGDDGDTKAGNTFYHCGGERGKVSFICPTLTAAQESGTRDTEEGSTDINLKVILG